MVKRRIRLKRFLVSDKKLWREFSRFEWKTKFNVDGRDYGGWYDALGDVRLKQFEKAFPDAKSVLELGSLEGGHTVGLGRCPGVERVLGLEGRDFNVEKANFIRSLYRAENIEFVLTDLEKDSFEKHGSFDVVFSAGLLYHLLEPWTHLGRLGRVSTNLFLCTHYAARETANTERGGYPGWMYEERGFEDPLSGLSEQSFWPTLDSLKKMVAAAGFSQIEIIANDEAHRNGPLVTLAGRPD